MRSALKVVLATMLILLDIYRGFRFTGIIASRLYIMVFPKKLSGRHQERRLLIHWPGLDGWKERFNVK